MKHIITMILFLFASNTFAVQPPKGVTAETIAVGPVSYKVYSAGSGPAVLLLHGYAQSAQMWFPLMEKWQAKYTLIAPDLKGIGDSSIAPGYDKKSVSAEIQSILGQKKIKNVFVVGHDIGLMVAYAFAAQFPEMTKKLVLMDAFLPGIGPGDEIYNSPSIWHFRFNGAYAERLVAGRERIFFDSLWDGFSAHPDRFKEEVRREYIERYKRPGRMRAGWEYFKAMPQDAKDNANFMKTKLTMPVLALGGEKSLGQAMATTVKMITTTPSSKILADCGHWLMEECQAETIQNLEEFLSN